MWLLLLLLFQNMLNRGILLRFFYKMHRKNHNNNFDQSKAKQSTARQQKLCKRTFINKKKHILNLLKWDHVLARVCQLKTPKTVPHKALNMSRKVVQERDIQQARWDCKWSILPEMIDTWATKATENADEVEFFKCIILGESVLEIYLQLKEDDEWREENERLADKDSLKKAHGYFTKALKFSEQLKTEKQRTNTTELHLLLVKYHFIATEFENVLKRLKEIRLETDDALQLPKRGCLLAAEALAYKGQALEAVGSTTQNEESIVETYKKSAEISLWLFTEGTKVQSARKSADSAPERSMPPMLFISFTKPAEIELQKGNINDAIDYYRSLLRAVETKGIAALRKVLALKLAELLLFGVSEDEYVRPPVQTWATEDRLQLNNVSIETYQSRSMSTSSSKSTPKPPQKDYGRSNSYGKEGSFCPQDEFEEALLLLLISESLLLQDACVSVFDKDKKRRKQTIDEATAIYDMLSIVLTKRKQYALLLECIERGIKLAYRQFNLWFKYGLALICNRKYEKALVVMKKCHGLEPKNVEVILYCAKIAINHLREYEEALKFAQEAIDISDDSVTKASCLLITGLSYSLLACQAINHTEELALRKKAIQALEKAHDLDPRDVEIMCQLALNLALAKEITRASSVVNQALKLDYTHRDSILLLALILSAQKKLLEALEIIDVALLDHPEDFTLLETKVQITEQCYGGEPALNVCQEMLQIWNTLYAEEIAMLNPIQHEVDNKSATGTMKKSLSESRLSEAGKSLLRLKFADGGKGGEDEDEASSISASVNLERNLFEAASSARSGTRLKTPAAIALLAKIWLITADVYLNMDNTEEASKCILEASSVFPVSPAVLYMRGRLNHIKENLDEAKACYECALAVAPEHIDSMENLAAIYHENSVYVMAEKFLRDAIAIKPANPFIWQALGLVLQSRERHEEAIDCFFTALDLEATHPILPFTLVPRLFKDDTSCWQ